MSGVLLDVFDMIRLWIFIVAQASLACLGTWVAIVNCAFFELAAFLIVFSIIAQIGSLICGLVIFKSQWQLGKVISLILMLLCLLTLPELLVRRLPAMLSDLHAGEQQRLRQAIGRARNGYPEAERLYKILVSKERSGYFREYSVADELDLARILVNEKKFEEAEGAYKHAIEKTPYEFPGNDALLIEFIKELADVYSTDKKYNESEAAYNSALAINDKSRKKREHESSYYDRTANRISAGYIKVLRESGRTDQADALEKATNNKDRGE
jgi:tetratricopeptide (TPR) repeat protein